MEPRRERPVSGSSGRGVHQENIALDVRAARNIWTNSPYTYKHPSSVPQRVSSDHELRTDRPRHTSHNSDQVPDVPSDTGVVSGAGWERGEVVWSCAPVGHHGDFYDIDELPAAHDDDDDDDEPEVYHNDDVIWGDSRTLFGRIQTGLLEKPSKRIVNKESRKQAGNGVRLADVITKVPLSKLWHKATEFWAISVFLANVVVASYDIIRQASYLQYKVSALVFGVIENIIVVSIWLVSNNSRFKNAANYEQRLKHFQYAENIIHEVLIYPLIVLNVVGFATEKMYQTPSDAFGWAQLILLVIDFTEVIYTQALRIYMLYRFIKDILKVIDPEANHTWCGHSLASYILQRAFLTFAGNIFLTLMLSAMFGIQVHKDNFTSNDYHLTLESGLLMVSFMLLPIMSAVLFIVINAYWVLEILVELNLHVAGDKQFASQLKDSYGDLVHDAVAFAQEKVPSSRERLETLRTTPTYRKIFFGVIELRVVVWIFLCEVFVFFGFYFFSGFNTTLGNVLMRCGFGLVLLLANIHLVLLMLLSNVSLITVILGLLFYPLTLPICCKNKYQIFSAKEPVV